MANYSVDDPLIWGVLPIRYLWNPDNMRWSLGSYDICFKNRYSYDHLSHRSIDADTVRVGRAVSSFFAHGQVLPTHRLAHSSFGGLFQPTMTQAIRLLSQGPSAALSSHAPSSLDQDASMRDITDPFSSAELVYTTNRIDRFPAPSAYQSRRHAWIHVFPEGKIHQKGDMTMRYFKWGVARLILESDPCPDVVPMWIEGFEQVMHEARTWPRFVPRVAKDIRVTFGDRVDVDSVFGDLRARWKELYMAELEKIPGKSLQVGTLTDALKYGDEAVELRKSCTLRLRDEVLKLRRQRGYPDEDPKARLVETWREEGPKSEGRMEDGSWVKDM